MLPFKSFVEKALTNLNCLVEPSGPGCLEAVIPEDVSQRLNVPNYLTLQFPEPNQPGLSGQDLVSPGSPLMQRIASCYSEKGLLARAYLNLEHSELAKAEEKLLRFLTLPNIQPSLQSQTWEGASTAVFHFKVSFVTDDREDYFYRTAVDFGTQFENEGLLQHWDDLFLDKEPADPADSFPQPPPVEALHAQALVFLKKKLEPAVNEARRTQERFLARDLARIHSYYDRLASEWEAKGKRAVKKKGPDADFSDRIAAIHLDRQKKEQDVLEKYRLDIQIETINLLLVHQPRIRCDFTLANRSQALKRTFFWDPFLKKFLDAPCDLCRNRTAFLHLQDQHLTCEKCLR